MPVGSGTFLSTSSYALYSKSKPLDDVVTPRVIVDMPLSSVTTLDTMSNVDHRQNLSGIELTHSGL